MLRVFTLNLLIFILIFFYFGNIPQCVFNTRKIINRALVNGTLLLEANNTQQNDLKCSDDELSFLGKICIHVKPIRHYTCKQPSNVFDAESDVCLFFTKESGISRISQERWQYAQVNEFSVWDGNNGGNDRNEQHAEWFDHYGVVNGSKLGMILEIGSGPFTQTKTILDNIRKRGESLLIESITLADPLMLLYHSRVPSCSYKSGSLEGYPTQFIAAGGEDLFLKPAYDTVIMINVLEHCRDVIKVLENLHAAIKVGGILVFGERWYDTKWNIFEKDRKPFWDILHPINVKRKIIESLLSQYTPILRKDFYYEGDYPSDEGVYFIGVKK
jgi:SAM-dependent methyltransferase